MTTYIKLPDFYDGDILSASRLNSVARNIDVAIGLDEQRNWPVEAGANVRNCNIYSRANDARLAGAEVDYYLAHNGDRLEFFHRRDGYSSTATLVYNYGGTGAQTFTNLASNVTHTLNLNALPKNKIVKIRITSTSGDDRLFVRRLFAYDSNAPTIAGMPAFADGTPSGAADINTIMLGTGAAVSNLNQPVVGVCSIEVAGVNKDLSYAINRNGYYGYIRHKHSKLHVNLLGECDGSAPGDRMYLTYNGVTIWEWPSGNLGQATVFVNEYFDVPAGLSVGSWYPVEFRTQWASQSRERFTIWQLCEVPATPSATIAAVTRWTHGDTAFGDTGGPPLLHEMTDALEAITSPMRWTNIACRAGTGWIPNESGVCSSDNELVDEFGTVRVHKWLAYENILKTDGTRAPVTLRYRTTNNTYVFTAVSLPAVNTPSYYDLDNTPIKPGMYFRVVGSKFCIQTPGYEGEE